jgi:hypothetical protein
VTWARLDDGFPGHPKIVGLSDRAFRAFVVALCHSAQYLTDGEISKSKIPSIANKTTRAELVAAGLWHERADGGIDVHDFLDYQPSREEVALKRQVNADRQRRFRERRRDPETGEFRSDRHGATKDVSHAASNASRNGVSHTTPARPDPSRPDLDLEDLVQESALDRAPSEKRRAVDALLADVEDRTETTEGYVWRFAEKLPAAAFRSAREALNERRSNDQRGPLTSEAKYVVSLLADWARDGRYETEAATR